MHVNEVENTCSMAELGDITLDSLKDITKQGLINFILDERPDTKAVIFNCIDEDIINLAKDKFDFEDVFSYRGNSSTDVSVLMLNMNEFI